MATNRVLILVLICVICASAEPDDIVLTRVSRTLPANLSPGNLSGVFKNLLPNTRFWEWPGSAARSFLGLLISPDTRKKMNFVFRPEDGMRASYAYQQSYGQRGEYLIELLGSGYHPNTLRYQEFRQPMPERELIPPPVPF